MPKPATFPTLVDDCLTLSITKLKRDGYIVKGAVYDVTTTWTSKLTSRTSKIGIRIDYRGLYPIFHLSYTVNGKPIDYTVNSCSVSSNLKSGGEILYFMCPFTNKRCRNLYKTTDYFTHRTYNEYAMYESQTYSKKLRWYLQYYGDYFKVDESYKELHKKHFKRTYKDKPTKRYQKLKRTIERSESFSMKEIHEMFML